MTAAEQTVRLPAILATLCKSPVYKTPPWLDCTSDSSQATKTKTAKTKTTHQRQHKKKKYSKLGIANKVKSFHLCMLFLMFETMQSKETEQIRPFTPSDRMRHLIKSETSLLMVMSRFGISLGFGEKTVREVCVEHNIDPDTFLCLANYISSRKYDCKKLSLPSLISYLKQAHSYFLEFKLPMIRRNLLEAIDCSGTDEIAFLILKFYDEYVTEVRRHMEYENEVVFTYVESLISGTLINDYRIEDFARKHNHIESKLKELKDIIVRYYTQKDNNLLYSVLFDIINCAQDLDTHCSVEDSLFVPAVELLETEVRERGDYVMENEEGGTDADDDKTDILSQREKEIIVCIAKGFSNKEIADELNISIHTVTTHRRNISSKLQIHSIAGITIYAIANGLVQMSDINIA